MDCKAANDAFFQFSSDTLLDSGQMYFLRKIVSYIVRNGLTKIHPYCMEVLSQISASELFDNVTIDSLPKVVEDA